METARPLENTPTALAASCEADVTGLATLTRQSKEHRNADNWHLIALGELKLFLTPQRVTLPVIRENVNETLYTKMHTLRLVPVGGGGKTGSAGA